MRDTNDRSALKSAGTPAQAMPESLSALPDLALREGWQDMAGTILQALLRSSKRGILITDHQKNDILCNPRFAELFDIDPDLVVRLSGAEVRRIALMRVKDPEAFSRSIEHIYADPMLEQEEDIALNTDPPRILRRTTGPVIDAKGSNIGRFWSFEDITELRDLQAEVADYTLFLEDKVREQAAKLQAAQMKLLETARMNAVGTLAVGIAHDIRNILATLRLELYVVGDTPGLASFQAQLDRLMTMTHRLLALSSEDKLSTSAVDMADLLTYLLTLMQSQAEIAQVVTRCEFEAGLSLVMGDARQLENLFVNLFLNALDAMPSGGTLTLSVVTEGESVRIDVTDTGEGITEEVLPHLFDAFYTTRANRSGLGLFGVRRIVMEHGGRIAVNSKPQEGTCVSVWLPRVDCKE